MGAVGFQRGPQEMCIRDREYKRHLAKLTLEPGASVAGIALRHRLNTNQLFKWRRWYVRQERLTGLEPEPAPEATLLPVVVASAGRAPPELPPTRAIAPAPVFADAPPSPAQPGQLEIALGPTPVRLTGSVHPPLLELLPTPAHPR